MQAVHVDNQYIENLKQKVSNLKELSYILHDNISNSEIQIPQNLIDKGTTKDSIYQEYLFLIKNTEQLLNSNRIFLGFTTYSERDNLDIQLENLKDGINGNNYEAIFSSLEFLKTLLRNFRTFTTKTYINDYYQAIKDLDQQRVELQNQLSKNKRDFNKIIDKNTQAETLLNNIDGKRSELDEKINKLEESYNTLEGKTESLNQKEQLIDDLLNSSKSKEELIRNFSTNVEKADKQLIEQQAKFDEYDTKIVEYKEEQNNLIQEAKSLIESAKEALKYKTAEGISAAMQEQYDNSKKWYQTVPWILLSLAAAVFTYCIGKTLFIDDQDYSLQQFFGRSLLLSITTTAMIFSARQYIKQKNIIEDYAYKQVLAKSLIGLSEEFAKDRGESSPYIQFMTKIQEEILQDPLRNRNLKEDNIDSPIDSLKNQLSAIQLGNDQKNYLQGILDNISKFFNLK